MAQLTKAQLATENQNDFPNNNSGLITPAILRDFNTDMIDSLVDEVSYNIDSASFSSSISQLQTFSSSLDATFATDAQLTSLSASIAVTDLAQSSSIAALQSFSSSLDATFATDVQLSASVAALSSSVAVTDLAQSASIAQLLGFSASIDTGFVSEAEFGAYSSSINSFTSSINSYTQSNDSKVNSLISKTGSYATTGSNSFIGNQNVTGAVTASSARISGLNYPTADGTALTFLQTDGAGNLSFDVVHTLYEHIRAGENITKGDALYVSGALGDNPIVYKADASNSNKMPVTYIASETVAANTNTLGITLGLLTGVNLTGFPVGTALYVDGNGTLTATRPTGSADIVQPIAFVTKTGNGGQINVLNPGPVLLPNIATNKVWVGNATNQPAEVSTSDLGLALTGSNNSFNGTQTFNNITVNGTASFAYTSTVTGSAVIIGEEYIILNNQTPTAPYAGLKVYDSGSTGVTASLLWDGVNDHWVYENVSGAAYGAAGFLSGPTGSSLSSIIYPSANRLVKGGGEDHLYDSNISDNGSVVSSAVNVEVTGSVTATGGFIGNASTATTASYIATASFANSSTSASFAQNSTSASFAQSTLTASFAQSALTASYVQTVETASFAQSALTASFAQIAQTAQSSTTASYVESASFAVNAGLLDGKDSTEFATTGSNNFKDTQNITGSLFVRSGSIFSISNNTTPNNPVLFLTESQGGQVNIIKGWGENVPAGGAGASQPNYTGSLRITGSNNTVSLPQIRATLIGGGADMTGYISGSDNVIAANLAGIFLNTGSQLFPKTQNNQLGINAGILMNFTTSSLSGGHPSISSNNLLAGTIVVNSNSGSITSLSNNWINAASLTTTQNFVTNTRPTISNNIITGNSVTINHISSSVTATANIINSPVTINNHLSSSGLSTNGLSFTNNAVLGGSTNTGLGVWVSGSQASNANRTIIDNLIGGKNNIVSSSFVSSSNSSLVASLIYGQNLVVNGNNSTTSGGSTFVGRFNDSGSLANSQNIVFAVGTGTSTSARRTGLWIDSGSNTTISGSLSLIGNTSFTGSVYTSGSVNGTVVSSSLSSNTASFDFSTANFFNITLGDALTNPSVHINPTNLQAGQTVNVRINTTAGGSNGVTFASNVRQPSGSAYTISTATTTDILTFVTFDTSSAYLVAVKNLI